MKIGRIISSSSDRYEVEIDNKIEKYMARGILKKNDKTPVVGDIVKIEEETIIEIEERKNYIERPKMANITLLILVISAKSPKPDLLLLDKQLIFAEYLSIIPIICLNKIDLDDISKISKEYKEIGYTCIQTNAKLGEGIEKIKEHLYNNITAIAGNSGVGKSSLINQLFGNSITEEGDISNKNKRGKNTTTMARLYKIDNNSYIADTPGFSTFDINEIESKDLWKYYVDMRKYEKNCRYSGCSHIKENECGIKEALKQGKIQKDRYDRYCQIYKELKEREERKW